MSDADPTPTARLLGRGRARLTVGAAVVLVVVALGVAVVMSAMTAAESAPRAVLSTGVPPATPPSDVGATVSGAGSTDDPPVLVHVLGEVRSPGIYELTGDPRALDAIAAAGGMTEAADPAGVNLARRVADGEQIVIPKLGDPRPPAGESSGSAGSGGGGPLSLSTATVDELDALPRIGPTIAQRIVDWREAGGRFSSVDDLLQIEGIGIKTVDALRDLVVP